MQDLGEGRLDCAIFTLALALPLTQSGKIKVLAVTNSKRTPVLPDVPTAVEAGFPDIHFEGLVGLFGPRGLPLARRDRIAADVLAVAAEPTIADRLTAVGQIARGRASAEFAAAIEAQRMQMEENVKLIGKAGQ
jgi:tripartite-type tricarboxylate transporter receptor subunit TctC